MHLIDENDGDFSFGAFFWTSIRANLTTDSIEVTSKQRNQHN